MAEAELASIKKKGVHVNEISRLQLDIRPILEKYMNAGHAQIET